MINEQEAVEKIARAVAEEEAVRCSKDRLPYWQYIESAKAALASCPYKQAYQKLLEQVMILPADAEPEVGDVVEIVGGHYHKSITRFPVPNHWKARFTGTYSDGTSKDYQGVKIIQRQGKPVIMEGKYEI